MLNDLAFTKQGVIYTTDTAGNCVYVIELAIRSKR